MKLNTTRCEAVSRETIAFQSALIRQHDSAEKDSTWHQVGDVLAKLAYMEFPCVRPKEQQAANQEEKAA